MDVSQLFESQFQLAIEKFKEFTPDQLVQDEQLTQIKISNDQFSEFCANFIVPSRKKLLEDLVETFNSSVSMLNSKRTFILTNSERISKLINRKSSIDANELDKKEQEILKSVRRKYINDLKSLEDLTAAFENLGDKIESKLSSIETSTIYKWEFTDQAYKTGSTIANTLRAELIAAGLIDSSHPHSSKENFKLLFHTKNINPYSSVQPIVWLGSYPQLYYLVSNLTKKVIKLKKSKPSHIDVIFHVFRDHAEESIFMLIHRRPNDPPADKLLLDKIIVSVENQIVMIGK